MDTFSSTESLPSALEDFSSIQNRIQGNQLAFFLDYDGTLTPIVSRPEDAILSDDMRNAIRSLASHYAIAIISGRDLEDVKKLVSIPDIFYAGSHGFDIAGPHGLKQELPEATKLIPTLAKAANELSKAIENFQGAQIERKKFSVAVHYRNVPNQQKENLKKCVEDISKKYADLKLKPGKQVLDLSPNLDWNKGKALLWLLNYISPDKPVFTIYIGDDLTDEDAFGALDSNGVGIIVREEPRDTKANYALDNTEEVKKFLQKFL